MKKKIMASLMASIMVVVALAAFVAPAQAVDDRVGSATNPRYIIGDAEEAYVLGEGETVSYTIDFNYSAYDSLEDPEFYISYTDDTGLYSQEIEDETEIGDIKITISGGNGIHAVTVEGNADPTGDSIEYVIEMTTTDTIWAGEDDKERTVELEYYYAMNIQVGAPYLLVLLNEENDKIEDISITLGEDFSEVFAKINVGDDYFESDKYDFYTTGLPEGIYMKSNGEIAGKVIGTADEEDDGKFYVFAVDIATGEKIYTGEFGYTISAPESYSFKYAIDNGEEEKDYVEFSEAGYIAIRNYGDEDDTIKVFVADDDENPLDAAEYDVVYTLSDSNEAALLSADITIEDGYFEIPFSTFEDYTGVIEIIITSGTCKAIIHVMVVGPIVHSGLLPAVTSA